MKPCVLVQFAAGRRACAAAEDRACALEQHQETDDAEEHDVAELDEKVDLTDLAQ